MLHLADLLGKELTPKELAKTRHFCAVGLAESLWHFTAEFAPQGDIGKYDDSRIEAALGWHGRPGKLVCVLVEAGLIDRCAPTEGSPTVCRLVVHDWHDHADDAVRKKLERSGLPFLSLSTKVTGQTPTKSGTQPDNGGLPSPALPSPALPEPAAVQNIVVELTKCESPTDAPPQKDKFPNSLAAVRERWPEADAKLLERIADKSNCDDDAMLELAIRTAHRSTGKRQYSQGMFLDTVPPIVDELRRQGLIPAIARNGLKRVTA
jgi:hypothetical protein